MPMMFFYFLKIIFDISTSKRSKKYKPHLILAKKNLKFDEMQLQTQCQTDPKLTCPAINFGFGPSHRPAQFELLCSAQKSLAVIAVSCSLFQQELQ